MILHSINKHHNSFIECLDNIFSTDSLTAEDPFTSTIKKSIDSIGMLNPILISTNVTTDHTKPYTCMIGNNRYFYAVRYGYTRIECLLIDDPHELKMMTNKLLIKPRKM
jgi:hypothetical protein